MSNIINIIQIVIAAMLVASILLQSRGAGLSQTFGGTSAIYQVKRRGAEKFLFITTIILSVIFLGLAFVHLFV